MQLSSVSTTVSVPKAGLYELSFDAKGRYTSFDNKPYNKGYCYSDQQQQLDVLFGQNWATVARVGTLQPGCLYFNRFRFQFMIPEAGNWELGLRSPDSAWDGCVFLDNFSLIRVAEVSRETVHPIPNGSFDRLVRPASGQGSPENPYFRGCFTVFNVPENWSFAVNPQALYGYALTNGVIGAVTSGTDAWKSSFMQMFPFAEAPLGAGALAFVSTGAVAATTFTVPAGTWRLRGKLQRWATYWAPDRADDKNLQTGTPNVRATLTRSGSSIDLGSVKASTQELLTKVWPNTFTVGAEEEVTLSLEQSVSSAFVLLDDLELVREDTYEPDNLIADSGFETWAGYWSNYWVPGRKTGYGVAGSVPHSDRPQYWGVFRLRGKCPPAPSERDGRRADADDPHERTVSLQDAHPRARRRQRLCEQSRPRVDRAGERHEHGRRHADALLAQLDGSLLPDERAVHGFVQAGH